MSLENTSEWIAKCVKETLQYIIKNSYDKGTLKYDFQKHICQVAKFYSIAISQCSSITPCQCLFLRDV